MAIVDLFNAAVAGMIIGWWMRDIGRAARALLERAAPAPRSALVDDGTAKPVPGDAPARTPGAEPVKRPFAESGDNRSGNGADDGDDDGFHANIGPKKQDTRQ